MTRLGEEMYNHTDNGVNEVKFCICGNPSSGRHSYFDTDKPYIECADCGKQIHINMKEEQNFNSTEINVLKPLFDIERKDLYKHGKLKDRTKKRLIEIAECGMEEIGFASFGYKGVMSGLYIEKVWEYSDEDFKNYMDWAKGLIITSLKGA